MQTQYRKLFMACDVDRNGFVTMEELRKTLFRFGLNKLGDATLETLFQERALSEEDEVLSLLGDGPSSDNDLDLDSVHQFQGPRLDFHKFVDFVEHAVELKTALDRKIPGGTSPLWWRKFRRELGFYKASFSLLWEQTKSAALLVIDHGRNLSRNERRLVWISVLDFVKVLPFAALLVAPGGSLIAPFMAKVFPSMMPSTFKVLVHDDTSSSASTSTSTSTSTGTNEGVGDKGGRDGLMDEPRRHRVLADESKEEGESEKANVGFDHDGGGGGPKRCMRHGARKCKPGVRQPKRCTRRGVQKCRPGERLPKRC